MSLIRKICNHKKNSIALFLAAVVFLTQIVWTYASDTFECHVIRYSQDSLIQMLEVAKEEKLYLNIDDLNLPIENEELRKKLISEMEGMLLLDTVTEEDGCVAYVSMDADTYEIALFTANMTEKNHKFEIIIDADKVSDTKVDVYSEEKPKEDEINTVLNNSQNEELDEAVEENNETEENTEIEENPKEQTETTENQDNLLPNDEHTEIEKSEPNQSDVELNEEVKENPPLDDVTDNNDSLSDSKDNAVSNDDEKNENSEEPKDSQAETDNNDEKTYAETKEKTEKEIISNENSNVVNENAEKEDDAQEKDKSTEFQNVNDSLDKTSQADVEFTTKKVLNSLTETYEVEEDTELSFEEPIHEEIETISIEKEPELIAESIEMGDVKTAKIEVPSGGFSVFRTRLLVKQDTVEYLPAYLYDYSSMVEFDDRYVYSDYYVGENNGALQGIADDSLSSKTNDGFYKFKSKRRRNPFPQQFSSSRGVDMENFYSCQFPFIVDSEGYYVYDSENRGISFNPSTNELELLQSVGPVFNDSLDSYGKNYGFYPLNRPGDNNPNSYFGMNFNFKFIMPKDGKVDNKDMIFEFSGDDDVWVYIDGKLALDLGGIHDKTSGSINFATGEITHDNIYNPYYNYNSVVTWNLYDRYNYVPYAEKDIGIKKDDYLQHTLQIFYLERGTGASNFKMRFNLKAIPTKSVTVTKEVTDVNTDLNEDTFDFTISSGQNSRRLKKETLTYTVNGEKRTASSGKFELKDGETAVFEIPQYWYVQFYEYRYNYEYKEPCWKLAGGELQEKRKSDVFEVGENGLSVVYVNRYNTTYYKVGSLEIAKKLENGAFNSSLEFPFYVSIDDKPYTGDVDIYTGDEVQTISIVGGALKLKANQRAVINDIPMYTKYEVFEHESTDYELLSASQNGTNIINLSAPISDTIDYYNKDHKLEFINRVKIIMKGSIKINNVILKNREAQGDPTFIYRLEKLNGSQVISTDFDYVRYQNGDTNSKQLIFDNLDVSYSYRISQDKTPRYDIETVDIHDKSTGYYDSSNNSVEFYLTPNNENVEVTFINSKVQDLWFSHTDVLEQDFVIND